MTAPIQGRRFYGHCDSFPPSPRYSTRLDMLVRIKRRTTYDTRVEAFSIVCDCVIMVTGHQSDVAEELCGRSEPQDDILISFADWTVAIIDPLKSSGLSPGKRPGSFGVSKLYGIAFYHLNSYRISASSPFIIDYARYSFVTIEISYWDRVPKLALLPDGNQVYEIKL